jgi:hypothetical protein
VPTGLEEGFVQGKERYDFVGLGSDHERLREWLTCEGRMFAQSQAEEDYQEGKALAGRKRNPPASAVVQQ